MNNIKYIPGQLIVLVCVFKMETRVHYVVKQLPYALG
jgi:hypothetical protein